MGLSRDEVVAKLPSKQRFQYDDQYYGQLLLRGLTGAERKVYMAEYDDPENPKHQQSAEYLIACGWIDDSGNNLFSVDDLDTVGELHAPSILGLANKVAQLSGITRNAFEAIAKNFDATKS